MRMERCCQSYPQVYQTYVLVGWEVNGVVETTGEATICGHSARHDDCLDRDTPLPESSFFSALYEVRTEE